MNDSYRLYALGLAVIALFAAVSAGVWAGVFDPMDQAVARGVADARPTVLVPFFALVTNLGDNVFLFALLALVAWVILGSRRPWRIVTVVAAALVMWEAVTLIKYGIGRERPDFSPLAFEASSSFPSGHSSSSAFAFVVLAGLALSAMPPGWSRRLTIGGLLAVPVLVGASRVLLGIHWPSDVLGGWAIGAGTALLVLGYVLRPTGAGDPEEATGGS